MKTEYLNKKHHIEVKDKRFEIHPTDNLLSGEREPPKRLGTQY